QFFAREVVAFQVVDSLDGDSARGDVADHMDGVVRPMLRWNTQYLGALLREAEPRAAGGVAPCSGVTRTHFAAAGRTRRADGTPLACPSSRVKWGRRNGSGAR